MVGLPVPKGNNEEDETRGFISTWRFLPMTNWHFQNQSLATTVVETMRFRKGSFSTGLLKFNTEWQ